MKRGTPRHPKLLELSTQLEIPRYAAAGLLEMLWHFAAEFALDGGIGKHTDAAISSALCWEGKSDVLIKGLTVSGWIDPCACHRLRVHDWPDHADQTVQRVLSKRKQEFLPCYDDREIGFLYLAEQESPDAPVKIGWSENPQNRIEDLQCSSPYPIKLLTIIPGSRADEAKLHAQFSDLQIHREWFQKSDSIMLAFELASDSTETSLPLPKANTNTNTNTNTPTRGFEAFWLVYPKKVGKQAAVRAWKKAVKLTSSDSIVEAVGKQLTCEQWNKDGGQYIPNPTTWLNQGRWEDEINDKTDHKSHLTPEQLKRKKEVEQAMFANPIK